MSGGNSKRTKKANPHGIAQAEELERRMSYYRRAASAYEHETLSRALRPLGVPGLLSECGRRLTTAGVNEHPLLSACYPLYLDICGNGKSNPPPTPWSKPLPALERMIDEFPGTGFDRFCLSAKAWKFDYAVGYAVIFAYAGTNLILHSRPDLTEGPALVSQLLPNGCRVEVHYYDPYIDDVADGCRHLFAEDGSELMDMIESNYSFREASWTEWADREPPSGW